MPPSQTSKKGTPARVVTARLMRTSSGITLLVFLCLFLVILANALVSNSGSRQSPYLLTLLLAFGSGFLTVANSIENLASRWGVAQGKWVLALVFGVIVYVERGRAMGDINAVFHVDPAALPMTLVAITATRTAMFFKWPFFGRCDHLVGGSSNAHSRSLEACRLAVIATRRHFAEKFAQSTRSFLGCGITANHASVHGIHLVRVSFLLGLV